MDLRLTDIGVIRELFERHGFSFSKSLGQNFLIDPSVCPKIAQMGGGNENVCALEIGTGVGVLTKELAKLCKRVVAVEIDKGLEPILAETLGDFGNVEIIFADVLKADLHRIFEEKFAGEEVVVCANLPYYITSPVIMKLLEERLPISSITVMVQKEAAERICAAPAERECGALSYAVRYYSEPRILFRVNRGSFMPSPNVDSAVIRLDVKRESPLRQDEEQAFFRVIRAGFSRRRKQLVNPLSDELKITKQQAAELLEKSKIKPSARAEELTMEQYFALARSVASEK